ncbi:MAG: helicase C-terminal domain-containing protein [Cyanobacteriota bacterium]|nr:helicase C-terminal domain-containing protein [Cyanobacteriota bacterium]
MNANSAYISRVHGMLKTFLREEGKAAEWPHHLTMARLVARALQLGRSALIQTGSARAKYGLSYLTPILLCEEPVVLVATQAVQQELLATFIPQLKGRLDSSKEICISDRVPNNFRGVVLTTPSDWLSDRLDDRGRFTPNIPVVIDPADDLEEWTRSQRTVSLSPEDWPRLIEQFPQQAEDIRNIRVKLTKSAFNRPKNPYECYLLDPSQQALLQQLFEMLTENALSSERCGTRWQKFYQHLQANDRLLWMKIARSRGQITLRSAPINVEAALGPIWEKQPVVLVGGFLDWESNASIYRKQMGLGELTCLKFSPNRQHEHIRLYLPDRLPFPNTPEFYAVALQQLRILVAVNRDRSRPIVILVEDVPLKAQVGATLAAEFGSSVQVEKSQIADNGILICGWDFWRSHFSSLPTPQLLAIATLPFPSVEHPLVAARVAYYKQNHQDWFRLYLLPSALRELQRAVVPIRESQGVVALLDNRANHRSYGRKILAALEPLARINYIDWDWFS